MKKSFPEIIIIERHGAITMLQEKSSMAGKEMKHNERNRAIT